MTFQYVAKKGKGENQVVVSNNVEADSKTAALKLAKAMQPGFTVTIEYN